MICDGVALVTTVLPPLHDMIYAHFYFITDSGNCCGAGSPLMLGRGSYYVGL